MKKAEWKIEITKDGIFLASGSWSPEHGITDAAGDLGDDVYDGLADELASDFADGFLSAKHDGFKIEITGLTTTSGEEIDDSAAQEAANRLGDQSMSWRARYRRCITEIALHSDCVGDIDELSDDGVEWLREQFSSLFGDVDEDKD